MSVSVRPMTTSDGESVAALTQQLGYDVTAAQIVHRCAMLAGTPQATALVAEDEGCIVGWIQVLDRVLLQEKRVLEIGGLVVDANRRGEGIGAQLVDAVTLWARQHGHTTLFVRSNVVREGAHDFYPAMGFVHQKTSHTYVMELEEPAF